MCFRWFAALYSPASNDTKGAHVFGIFALPRGWPLRGGLCVACPAC